MEAAKAEQAAAELKECQEVITNTTEELKEKLSVAEEARKRAESDLSEMAEAVNWVNEKHARQLAEEKAAHQSTTTVHLTFFCINIKLVHCISSTS